MSPLLQHMRVLHQHYESFYTKISKIPRKVHYMQAIHTIHTIPTIHTKHTMQTQLTIHTIQAIHAEHEDVVKELLLRGCIRWFCRQTGVVIGRGQSKTENFNTFNASEFISKFRLPLSVICNNISTASYHFYIMSLRVMNSVQKGSSQIEIISSSHRRLSLLLFITDIWGRIVELMFYLL